MNRCRTCKFYEPHAASGRCRRNPPQMVFDDIQAQPAGDGVVTTYRWVPTWPPVDPEDWCGEQRQLAFPRPEAQP